MVFMNAFEISALVMMNMWLVSRDFRYSRSIKDAVSLKHSATEGCAVLKRHGVFYTSAIPEVT